MGQDGEQSSVRVEDRGFTTLHEPRDEQSVIADLVFVHGLQGHPRRTWQSPVTPQQHTLGRHPFKRWKRQQKDKEEAGLFWPADLIPRDFPNLRVLTYGYDSKITGYYASSAGKNGIFDHGNALLNALNRERTNLSNRPIIFVAHSLGGLVVKQAIIEARKRVSSGHIHDIYTSARAVIFFGTPHRGSDSASWGLMATNLAKAAQMDVNDAILRDLDPASGSSKLLELRRDFHDVLQDSLRRSPLQLYTFQEELGMTSLKALGGKVIPVSFQMLHYGDKSSFICLFKVVTNESSSFDSPDYGYDSIHANHMNMCRFTGMTDDEYRKFRDVLSTYVQEVVGKRAVDEQAERQVQRESLDGLMRNLDFAERRSREYQLRSLDTDQSSFGWIWDSAFADWLSSSEPLFWLRGKPASGKSTLTQYLVHNGRTQSKLQEYKNCEWLTTYFFFDFRGGKGINNNFEGLLRSLLVQLLDAMPELKECAPAESSTYWHEARLRECLLSAFDHSSKGLCLFIDGLDEYEGDMLQLLRFLKKLQTVGEDSRTPRKIYVSSRPEPVPSELLEGTPSLSMSEENGRGIHAYIQSTIKDMPSMIAEDPQWRALCDELVERADGVFLWARFALDELIQGFCKGESIDELSVRLQSVPNELEGIYKRIVDRMEPQARNEAFVMLQIACSTPRALFLQDFLVAMNFTMETDLSIRRFVGRSELQMFSRRVRAKVGGLLEIIELMEDYHSDDDDGDEDDGDEDDGDEDDGDEDDNSEDRTQNAQDGFNDDIDDNGFEKREELIPISQVKLTHKTINTFLDKCGWQLLQPQRQILPGDGYLLLLKACSKYLKQILNSFHCYGDESPVARYVTHKIPISETLYPFLAYSASTLFYHARRVEIVGNLSSYAYIKEVITPKFGLIHLALAKNNPGLRDCLCSIGSALERYPYNGASPFAHGLPKTCEEIIRTHTSDENFSIDEALNEAILSSHLDASNANVLPCYLNNISLMLSKITQTKQCHLERAMAIPAPVDVLRLLLSHRSFENVQILTDDGRRATLLWLFIHSKIHITNKEELYANLKLIIERGEDVNGQCGPEGSALDYAVRHEDEFSRGFLINALVSCGAYKTVDPNTLSKPIIIRDAHWRRRRTTLRTYLAREDGFDLGLGKAQKDKIKRYLAESAVMPRNLPSTSGGGITDD